MNDIFMIPDPEAKKFCGIVKQAEKDRTYARLRLLFKDPILYLNPQKYDGFSGPIWFAMIYLVYLIYAGF